jgi:hypothetical protein
LAGHPGKRGRAVELSTNSTPQGHTRQQNGHFEIKSTVSDVLTTTPESSVVDLFGIGAKEVKKGTEGTRPFIHQVQFHGPQGEVVRIWANVDDGAMREVMSSATFKKVKHRLGASAPSSQLLRVANGVVVQSEARWKGEVEVNGIKAEVVFEVFDSGGKWDFLFGKTLLERFKAIHNYESDEIVVHGNNKKATLRNQSHIIGQAPHYPASKSPICIVTEEPQQEGNDEPSEVNIEALQGNHSLFTQVHPDD